MNATLSMLKQCASLLSPAGRRAQLLILTYHRVLEAPDPLLPGEVDVARFTMQLETLTAMFNVMTLSEAAGRLRQGTLPARAACITFDDGYGSNARIGVPLLQQAGLPATFFIATGFLDGGRMFNDTVIETVRRLDPQPQLHAFDLGTPLLDDPGARLALIEKVIGKIKYMEPAERNDWTQRFAAQASRPLPDDLMMTRDEVAALSSSGIEVGAHTVTHPILARIDDDAARKEIRRSVQELRELTGTAVESFAFPNGTPGTDYQQQHARMLPDFGLKQAVTTAWGVARRSSDPFQLPRLGSWDRTATRFALRLLRAYLQPDATRV